jgi:hypothetical protein
MEHCSLYSHLFEKSILLYNELEKRQTDYVQITEIVKQTMKHLGMLLCGAGLNLYYNNDILNAMIIFQLAIPYDNCVANAFITHKGFETVEFLETKKRCDELFNELIRNSVCIKNRIKIIQDKLYMQKMLVDASINVERSCFNNLKDNEMKTYNEIKNAVELACYNIDFDIENFYNFEELNILHL